MTIERERRRVAWEQILPDTISFNQCEFLREYCETNPPDQECLWWTYSCHDFWEKYFAPEELHGADGYCSGLRGTVTVRVSDRPSAALLESILAMLYASLEDYFAQEIRRRARAVPMVR